MDVTHPRRRNRGGGVIAGRARRARGRPLSAHSPGVRFFLCYLREHDGLIARLVRRHLLRGGAARQGLTEHRRRSARSEREGKWRRVF